MYIVVHLCAANSHLRYTCQVNRSNQRYIYTHTYIQCVCVGIVYTYISYYIYTCMYIFVISLGKSYHEIS